MIKFYLLLALVGLSESLLGSEITTADFLSRLEPLQKAELVTTPDSDHTPLLNAFAGARRSIKVGIFGISGKHIADGLEAAQKRGVSVTILCDKYCISNEKRAALIDQLKAAGVNVVMATKGFTISHWKMFVIDDSRAFISTMNFISRHNQMRDLGVFITNPKAVNEILSVFNADIENAKNQGAVTPKLTHPNLVWSPVNAEDKLVQLISSASKTIDIWIENMGNRAIHAALKAAVARAVKVRLMTSMCGLGMEPAAAFLHLHQLKSFGVLVQVMPYPASPDLPYVHAKVIISDGETTFLGSENFSTNSLLKARELGIIFKDRTIQSQISPLFESDWKKTVTLPSEAPEACEALQP